MTEPLRARILDAVETTLAGIRDQDGYHMTPAVVTQRVMRPEQAPEFPAYIVREAPRGSTRRQHEIGGMATTMFLDLFRVQVLFYVTFNDIVPRPAVLLRAEEDIAKAICANATLGGLGEVLINAPDFMDFQSDGGIYEVAGSLIAEAAVAFTVASYPAFKVA